MSHLCSDHYLGFTTVTVYFTNMGLIMKMLNKAFFISYAGLGAASAHSLFIFKPLTFNVIDVQYTDGRDQTNGGRIDVDDDQGNPIVPPFKME